MLALHVYYLAEVMVLCRKVNWKSYRKILSIKRYLAIHSLAPSGGKHILI